MTAEEDLKEIVHLLKEQNRLLSENRQEIATIGKNIRKQTLQLEQIRHSVGTEMHSGLFEKIWEHQMTPLDTLHMVAAENLSLARFGDGELGLAAHERKTVTFQVGSVPLKLRLQEVLKNNAPGLLVAVPSMTVDVTWMTTNARYWGVLRNVVPHGRAWGDADVSRSRPFLQHGQEFVDAWRKVWHERNITIVTGQGSRFEAIPELFSNAAGITYYYGPSRDAFEEYPRILEEVGNLDTDLVLVALGPAGTILSHDLHRAGKQTIDIGHLPNSFNEAFHDGEKPDRLPIDSNAETKS